MDVQCFSLTQVILRQRPFVYFPKIVQDEIKRFFNKNFQACCSAFFLETPCKPEKLEEKKESNECSCWKLDKVEYYSNGVDKINIRVSSLGIEVKGYVELTNIGVIQQPNGKFEQVGGSCPEKCIDNDVSGIIACELSGKLTFSSNLLEAWNRHVRMNFLTAFLFPQSGFGDINSGQDYIKKTSESSYTYTLTGGGPNKGIIYQLGRFYFTP